jgi:hypothetical protein
MEKQLFRFSQILDKSAIVTDEFPPDVREAMWDQGIDLDDWDYAIILPISEMECSHHHDESVLTWMPKHYLFHQMLHGCCNNEWYSFKWDGAEFGIGLAYHS